MPTFSISETSVGNSVIAPCQLSLEPAGIVALAARRGRAICFPPVAEEPMSNPLVELAKVGQSVWFDQMERRLITTGKLKQMIEEDDLRGMTSNPTIFEKAIGGSADYDAQLRQLASQNKSREEIFDELAIKDIGDAADIFRPVYDRCKGNDGFISIEVNPLLASDTAATISEAKRLFERLARPNVMVKIPGTPEGIPAIQESLFHGININITLLFSNDVYR